MNKMKIWNVWKASWNLKSHFIRWKDSLWISATTRPNSLIFNFRLWHNWVSFFIPQHLQTPLGRKYDDGTQFSIAPFCLHLPFMGFGSPTQTETLCMHARIRINRQFFPSTSSLYHPLLSPLSSPHTRWNPKKLTELKHSPSWIRSKN